MLAAIDWEKEYIYIYIYIYTHTHVSCLKSSKPHLERRAIAEHFLLQWQHTTTFYKTNSDFCLNFCEAPH